MNKQAIAKLNHLRISPRKVRLVASLLKGLSVNEAEAQLLFQIRRPAKPILKLLRSAVANAKNQQMKTDQLGIVKIEVNQGPRFKRFMPRARGSASLIEKKSSHITLVLEESEKFKPRFKIAVPKKEKKTTKKAAKKSTVEKPAVQEPRTREYQPSKPGFFRKIFRRKSI
ncbi:MAG: 50S ribosomal protein L22 [Candidatus Brennerbacteria bacterium]|nr:50S ribosomal protein L22 [Candidatus Brennerbacteria bacterium]